MKKFSVRVACSVSAVAFGCALFIAAPAFAADSPLSALTGGPGTQGVPISELAEEKRVQNRVDALVKEKLDARHKEIEARQAAGRAAAAQRRSGKERPATTATGTAQAGSDDALAPAAMPAVASGSAPVASEKPVPAASSGGAVRDYSVAPGEQAAPAAKGAKQVAALPVPAMVINFGKNFVYFDHQLRQMVNEAERSKKAVHYTVISQIPSDSSGGHRNSRAYEEYDQNLRSVVDAFAALGVQGSRISVTSQPTEGVAAQTVSIFKD